MFTGIVQTVGRIAGLEDGRMELTADASWAEDIQVGESIAVNGCCLTVVATKPDLAFDLSKETLARSSLGRLGPGAGVNLERALRASDRLGGHFVQGHVDGVGTLLSRTAQEGSEVFRFKIPPEGDRYLIDKGSIALDGISLTVVRPEKGEFDVWVVPHTLENTHLGRLRPGDAVNVEYDVLAKHVERLIRPQ